MESTKSGGDICIFCYKNTNTFCSADHHFEKKSDPPNSTVTVNLVERFLNLLERFSDCRDKTSYVERVAGYSWSKFLGCCGNCIEILNTFCEEYHQLKILELKLDWKLERLTDIMKLAGRIPVREKKLRRLFQRYAGAENCNEDRESLETFKGFRGKIISRCTNRLGKSQPKILLERNADAILTACNSSSGLTDTMHDEEIQEPDLKDFDNDDASMLEEEISSLMSNIPVPNDTTSGHISENETESTIKIVPRNATKADAAYEESAVTIQGNNEADENLEGDRDPDWHNDDDTISSSGDSIDSNVDTKRKFGNRSTTSKTSSPKERSRDQQNDITEDNEILTCRKCNKTNFKTKLTLRLHVKYCQVPPKFQCSECGKAFKRKRELRRHEIIHKDPSAWQYSCRHCSLKFKRRLDLNTHKLTHEDPSTWKFKCGHCDRPFRRKQDLENHELTHQDRSNWKFQCDHCSRRFIRKQDLEKHELTHQDPSLWKYPCSQCSRIFSNNDTLRYHVRAHHNTDKSEPINCNICEKTFTSRSNLNLHMKSIHEESSFQCSECGKNFKTMGNLNGHMLTHNRDSWRFVCSKCGKKWPSKHKLERHMISHDDNDLIPRNYQCLECGKSFKTADGLSFHSMLHKDPSTWKYKCSICEKMFYLKTPFERHMESHQRKRKKVKAKAK